MSNWSTEKTKRAPRTKSITTLKEAEKRKKEIEYKQSLGTFVVPKCTRVKELIKEYVRIYGHNEW